MKTFLSLFIVIILAVFSWWLQGLWSEKIEPAEQPASRFVDNFMDGVKIRYMNSEGRPHQTLQAQRVERYGGEDVSLIISPVLHLHSDSGVWIVRAERGEMPGSSDIIRLYDDVVIRRPDDSPQGPVRIETDYMQINTETEQAETDRPVHLTTDTLDLRSIGMTLDHKTGVVKFLSNVKGRYEIQADTRTRIQ